MNLWRFTRMPMPFTGQSSPLSRMLAKLKTDDAHFRRVVGKIYSGAGKMNAATVTASVEALGKMESRIRINASAQEGLIKQHTAPRAISRLLDTLSQAGFPTSPPAPASQQPTGGDALDQIARLAVIRDSGAIAVTEFESKKAELLKRI